MQVTFFPAGNCRAQQAQAQAIRDSLAPWRGQSSVPWHLWDADPGAVAAGDFICLTRPPEPQALASLLATGAVVLVSEVIDHGKDGEVHDTLYAHGAVYRLQGVSDAAFVPALGAFLDAGFEPHDALCLARAWRSDASHACAPEHGLGTWPVQLKLFPRVMGLARPAGAFGACPSVLGLYPVVPDAGWIERLGALGVATLQLRAKSGPQDYLQTQVRDAVAAAKRHPGTRLFINDHWRLALAAGAYGVHLGQEDLRQLGEAELAELSGAGVRLGLSTHGYYEMLVAHHYAPSYIAMGAVFPTTTKVMPTAPQGLDKLSRYVRLMAPHYPLVAIGGVNSANLDDVLATGVGSAAVVRAVTEAADLPAAVEALQALVAAASPKCFQ